MHQLFRGKINRCGQTFPASRCAGGTMITIRFEEWSVCEPSVANRVAHDRQVQLSFSNASNGLSVRLDHQWKVHRRKFMLNEKSQSWRQPVIHSCSISVERRRHSLGRAISIALLNLFFPHAPVHRHVPPIAKTVFPGGREAPFPIPAFEKRHTNCSPHRATDWLNRLRQHAAGSRSVTLPVSAMRRPVSNEDVEMHLALP